MTIDTTAPELEIAQRRLAALPAVWVTCELHDAVIVAAEQDAFAREVREAADAARQAVDAARDARDVAAYVAADSAWINASEASRTVGAAATVHVDGATDVASTELREAVAAMPADPMLSVEVEQAAWRTTTPH